MTTNKQCGQREAAMAALNTLAAPDGMRPLWLRELESDVHLYIRALEEIIDKQVAALDENEALQAECEKLRKDAERLDFIAQHPGWLRSHKGRWGCVSPFTNYSYPVFKTPRDAIDAAMEEHNP